MIGEFFSKYNIYKGRVNLKKIEVFDIDPVNYDLSRPKYPKELYSDVFKECSINSNSQILEIGIGTGQATLPFLESGANVTAVELGKNLASFTAYKYKNYDNFKLMEDDFMTCDFHGQCFNLIFSATAFHWLPTPQKYEKAFDLLNTDGYLVLFWNRPYTKNKSDPSNTASASVYDKYFPVNDELKPFENKDLEIMINELNHNKFRTIYSQIYKRVRALTTTEYISLLNTYSDHRTLPYDVRKSFEKDMIKALERIGGFINIYDTIDLYIAKKL